MSSDGAKARALGPAQRAEPMRVAFAMLGKAIVVYVVLMVLWKPVAPGVAWGFRIASNVASAGVYRGAIQVRYVPGAIGSRDADTIVHYKDTKQRVASAAGIGMSSWYYAFVPLSMIVSLAFATPIAWARRARVLLVGTVVMALTIVLGQMLMVYDELVRASVLPLGARWAGVVHACATVVRELPGSFFLPIVVYGVVVGATGELGRVFGGDGPVDAVKVGRSGSRVAARGGERGSP